jgi:hypothetical protein
MDTLFEYGVRGKLYRLWYELYRDAQIKVKTGAGMTDTQVTGKCCIIVFDKKNAARTQREAINKNKSIAIGANILKAKIQDKYLGDFLNEGDLRKSVVATISDRYGKAFNAIKEIGAVISDFRIDAIGGLKAGLDIFEMVVIPSVLNNSGMWVEIDRASINRLEDLQNWMFKDLLVVPHCVPTPSLRYELGCLSMEERIHSQKLNLLFHIRNLDSSSLAKEIYEIQRDLNYPGLVKECRNLIIKYDLPNIIDNATNMTKLGWKNMVKPHSTIGLAFGGQKLVF